MRYLKQSQRVDWEWPGAGGSGDWGVPVKGLKFQLRLTEEPRNPLTITVPLVNNTVLKIC